MCACLVALSRVPAAHASRTFEQRRHVQSLDAGLDPFLGRVQRYLGPRYGDVWIDYKKNSIVVHIGLVSRQPGDLRALRDPYSPGLIPKIEPAQYSYRDLNRFGRHAARVSDRFEFRGCYAIGFAVRRNKVSIDLCKPNPEFVRVLKRTIPPGALAVQVGKLPEISIPRLEIETVVSRAVLDFARRLPQALAMTATSLLSPRPRAAGRD